MRTAGQAAERGLLLLRPEPAFGLEPKTSSLQGENMGRRACARERVPAHKRTCTGPTASVQPRGLASGAVGAMREAGVRGLCALARVWPPSGRHMRVVASGWRRIVDSM
jgi:hypothetical protein